MGETGLEPARLAPRDPKSRVSAISPLAQPFSPDWELPLGWFPCRMDSRGNVPRTCGPAFGLFASRPRMNGDLGTAAAREETPDHWKWWNGTMNRAGKPAATRRSAGFPAFQITLFLYLRTNARGGALAMVVESDMGTCRSAPDTSHSEGGTSNGGTRSCKSPISARIITTPNLKAPL